MGEPWGGRFILKLPTDLLCFYLGCVYVELGVQPSELPCQSVGHQVGWEGLRVGDCAPTCRRLDSVGKNQPVLEG